MVALLPGGIRARFVLALAALLVPMLLLELLSYAERVEERRQDELRANLELARSVARIFDLYLRDIVRRELALGIALTDGGLVRGDQAPRYLAAAAVEHPALRSFSLTDPRGRVVAHPEPVAVGLDLSDRGYLREIVAGREWTVSDLLVDPVSGEESFAVARGVRDSGGTLLGVVVATVDVARLGEVLRLERAGQGSVGIVDRQGTLVYRFPEVAVTGGQRRVQRTGPMALALGGTEVTSIADVALLQQRRMAALVPIQLVGWVATSSTSEADVIGAIQADALRRLGLLAVVTVVALAAALLIGGSLVRPVQRLRDHLAAVGRGEFAGRAALAGPREIAEMAAAVNRMADALAERLAQEQAARQRLQEFMAMVSHDLGTPLTAIAGQVQLMQRRHDGRSEADTRALAAVGEATRRARRLLEDLRDAARIGRGWFEVKPSAMDLVEVARRVVDEQQATTRRHRLVLDGPERIEGVWDQERIDQVLTNLLSNAIKYSPDGGEVRLVLQASDGEVVVSVADRGLGIPPERQHQLFEPFSRLHPEHDAPGTGLGLYIVKGIAGAHGGGVSVESAPGTGTTFVVALPRGPEMPRPAEA